MLPLSRSDPLLLEFPPFILYVLEVIDSPVESSKYARTRNEQEPKAPSQNLGKPDGSIWQTGLSSFVGIDGSQGHRRASMRCSSSGQATSGRWRGMNHDNFDG
jgi:hypothetical protein